MIEAIQTTYNGTTFRSRTEARVAIALQSMGLRMCHEPEGFDLVSGRYVPDFWCPDVLHFGSSGIWIEAKGLPLRPNDIDRACELARLHAHTILIIEWSGEITTISSSPWQEREIYTKSKHGLGLVACSSCGSVHLAMESCACGVCTGALTWAPVKRAFEAAERHRFLESAEDVMSTALALYRPTPLVCRAVAQETPMFQISAFMGRRERLHFAFLHIVKRIWIEGGKDPSDCERTVIQDLHGHVHWWKVSCKHLLHRTLEMNLAEDEDLMAVVVPLSHRVAGESELWPWYPDGWQESVRWAQAGCPLDARDMASARTRAANAGTNADRMAALDTEGRLDAEPIVPSSPPDLRIVQQYESAGPLFTPELPPVSMDLEADIEAEWEDS